MFSGVITCHINAPGSITCFIHVLGVITCHIHVPGAITCLVKSDHDAVESEQGVLVVWRATQITRATHGPVNLVAGQTLTLSCQATADPAFSDRYLCICTKLLIDMYKKVGRNYRN